MFDEAILPTRGNQEDAGFDLYSPATVNVWPNHRVVVRTGIRLEIPQGHVGLIMDKSSIAINKGLTVLAGVIDSGYRGEILVAMYNTTNKMQVIEQGQKFAQIVIQKFEDLEIEEVAELSESIRGEGRIGSTGK